MATATGSRNTTTGLRLRDALKQAEYFLAPVLHRENLVQVRGQSLVERLIARLPDEGQGRRSCSPRAVVVKAAISNLQHIHDALIEESDTYDAKQILFEIRERRVIDGLLDLISLEGIYPAISPGVGIPIERRVKSVLQAGVAARPIADVDHRQDTNFHLLKAVIDGLSMIALAGDKGVNPAIRERILVDIICGCGELAYGPSNEYLDQRNKYNILLDRLLDESAVSILFPILTALLQPTCPQWLRTPLSTALASLPLRPAGVRQTITFLGTTMSPPKPMDPPEASPSNNNNSITGLSLEILAQASKLLSSVPSFLSPEDYFTQLAPQLLDLLDNGPDNMRTAASFIIGSGILGRKIYGAPDTIGWRLFVQPIIRKLNPTQDDLSRNTGLHRELDVVELTSCIVEEVDLHQALNRLVALTLYHPNPGLTKRLVGQVVLPLWSLLCYARKTSQTAWHDQASKLLQTYFKTAASVRRVLKVAEELLWDGGPDWRYGPGRQGGVEIRKRPNNEDKIQDGIALIAEVDERVEELLQLLNPGLLDHGLVADVFISIAKRRLLTAPEAKPSTSIFEVDSTNEDDPLQMLIYAKIAQQMMQRFKSKLAKSPERILELVDQLLEEYVKYDKRKNRQPSSGTPGISLARLGTIVEHNTIQSEQAYLNSTIPGAEDEEEHDRDGIVSIALSLLVTVLSSPDPPSSHKSLKLLSDVKSSLTYISSPKSSIPSSLSTTAKDTTSLIVLSTSALSPSAIASGSDTLIEDRKTYNLALTYLSDPVVPVRAQGLSLLTALITSSSRILDISATSILLLSLLQDEDEFVYLNVIKSLSLLAQHHPRTIIKMLVERYLDREEEMGLDQRLKLGEALLRIVEGLGVGLARETATIIGEGMIALAGRRGQRPKTEAERHKAITNKQAKKEEAERAWGGEVPLLGEGTETDLVSETFPKIIEGWKGKDAEDVRIRTSALSVLGATIEANLAGLGSTITSTAVDMTISVLTVELGDEKAILRRAAVLVILSLVMTMDKAREEGRRLGFGFAGENLEEVLRVLQYVEDTDKDELVRGHTAAVLESLEAWRMKSLLGATSLGSSDANSSIALGGSQLAGLSVGPDVQSNQRLSIEEVD